MDIGAPMLTALHARTAQLMLGIRTSRTPEVVRIARAAGHHAIMIDLEHSSMPIDTASQMCAVAGDLGMTALVRIPENDFGVIGRLLDGGAHGIVAPRIESVDAASAVVEASRFPPDGHRSQTATVPQLGMTPTPAAIMNPQLNAQTIVQILIESPEGVRAAPAIAEIPGVDILAFGVNDYTSELGVPGDLTDPRLASAIQEVGRAAEGAGKLAMLGGISDLSRLGVFLLAGYCPLFLTGTDSDLLFAAAKARAIAFGDWHQQLDEGN